MNPWSPDVEEELALVLKDWLKQQGRTQADLRRSLRATSTRMPALMEVLKESIGSEGSLVSLRSSATSKPIGSTIPQSMPALPQET